MEEFKETFKEKANGRFKKKKPLVTALRNDRRGGKLNVTNFSWEMNIIPKYFKLLKHSFTYSFKVFGVIDLFVSHFQAEPSST